MKKTGIRSRIVGEWVEALFGATAARKHLELFKPFSNTGPIDWLIAHHDGYYRIQVRGTAQKKVGDPRSYRVSTRRGCNDAKRTFTAREIDFFAAYVIPQNTWYIIPIEVVARHGSSIAIGPRHKFEQYREAWQLLRQPPPEEAAAPPLPWRQRLARLLDELTYA